MNAKDDPKLRTFDAKETIKNISASKDPSQITGGRIREISRAKRDGVAIETTPVEDAAYDQFRAAMSGTMSATLANALPNLGPISLAISRVQETENNIRRLHQEPRTIVDKMRSAFPEEMDISHLEAEKHERDEKKAAKKARQRDLEDQHLELAARQGEVLSTMLEVTTAEQIASATREAARIQANNERDEKARGMQLWTILGMALTVIIAAATLIVTMKAA